MRRVAGGIVPFDPFETIDQPRIADHHRVLLVRELSLRDPQSLGAPGGIVRVLRCKEDPEPMTNDRFRRLGHALRVVRVRRVGVG